MTEDIDSTEDKHTVGGSHRAWTQAEATVEAIPDDGDGVNLYVRDLSMLDGPYTCDCGKTFEDRKGVRAHLDEVNDGA